MKWIDEPDEMGQRRRRNTSTDTEFWLLIGLLAVLLIGVMVAGRYP